MLSPLSRGYGTWTGNYDPYNEEGVVSFKILNLKNQEYDHRNKTSFLKPNSPIYFYLIFVSFDLQIYDMFLVSVYKNI